MPKHNIQLQYWFSLPPEPVFEALADHERFGRLWPGRTRRIRDGDSETNGVGSVREVKAGPVSLEETTITHESPRLIEYTITRGTPLRNHHGRMELQAVDGGTQLDYRIVFDCVVPLLGGLIAKQLERDFYRAIDDWAAKISPPA